MHKNYTSVNGQVSSGRVKRQAQELYIQIKDGVADQIIEHGLSRAESKLFFFLFKLNRFGDKPVKVKVAEILLGAGICKSAYHKAIARFEAMGWFGFKHSDVEISNFCVPTKLSTNVDSQSTNVDSQSTNVDSQSTNVDSQKLKVLPVKGSETSQTYSDLLNTLSEGVRERFDKFCKKKIEKCSFRITSRKLWLNKHGAEYWEEFQEKYPNALANAEGMAPKTDVSALVDIPCLQRLHGDGWQEEAKHHGLIPPNSLAVEIQDELEQAPSKFATDGWRPSPEQFRQLREIISTKKAVPPARPKFTSRPEIAVDDVGPVEDSSGVS